VITELSSAVTEQHTQSPLPSRPRKNQSAERALSPLHFWLLAMVIGLVGGFGAFLFRGTIAFFHNLFFLGKISFLYESNIHTPPSPWGPLIIFVPVVGGMGVTWLVQTFARKRAATVYRK
jgi:chloride channel protein, CIC family